LEDPGGAGRFFPLAKSLTKLGHHVTIIGLHPNYTPLAQKRFVRDQVKVWYVGQMHVLKTDKGKEYFGSLKLLWITLFATVKLAFAALITPTDVVHVCKTQPMNGIAAWFIHHLQGVPVYLDSDDYEAGHNFFTKQWQQRIVSFFENWMINFADGITANTNFITKRYERLGYPRGRIILVPNGVDRTWLSLLQNTDLDFRLDGLREVLDIAKADRVIVYVGSLRLVSHAVDLLLEAFAEVLRSEPNALLLLVGGGRDREKLQSLASELGIEDRVRFAGRVPYEEVPLYYRLAEISVDPRLDSIPARASLSLKIFESIAVGVPCITTDVGDRREYIGRSGLAIPPGDKVALTEAILFLLSDSSMRDSMHHNALVERSEHFWDERVGLFTEVYRWRVE
jgi:glycosyltransferase involved in cell wall biosynthesis